MTWKSGSQQIKMATKFDFPLCDDCARFEKLTLAPFLVGFHAITLGLAACLAVAFAVAGEPRS